MTTDRTVRFDEDGVTAMQAAALLVGHTGAQHLEFGYLHDDVPMEEAAWWASAQYRGARITAEAHASPVQALEALAQKLLTGGRCTWCQGLVALTRDGAIAYPGAVYTDGETTTPETEEEIAALGQCLWRRNGKAWQPGCLFGESTAPGAPKSKADRKRLVREYERTRSAADRR